MPCGVFFVNKFLFHSSQNAVCESFWSKKCLECISMITKQVSKPHLVTYNLVLPALQAEVMLFLPTSGVKPMIGMCIVTCILVQTKGYKYKSIAFIALLVVTNFTGDRKRDLRVSVVFRKFSLFGISY